MGASSSGGSLSSTFTSGITSLSFFVRVPPKGCRQNRHTKAQLGALALFSGAVAQTYDGSTSVEQGFLYYPEIQSLVNAAGGVMSAGTYQYIVVYEWQDADGQRHQSTPAPAKSITVAANDKVTVTIPTLRLTSKTSVLINVYRTIANGTIFYKHSNIYRGIAVHVGQLHVRGYG
jgi:hypothetical protein